MAQTYNKLKIDIKEPVTDIITAKQNDSNSRFLDVYLYDGGVPIDLTGHEVRIYMLKADGTEVFNYGAITDATAGRCQFELTDQALGAYGKLLCEISIWYDNVQILTTPTFDIHVVKKLRTNGSIESSNEYGALVVLYQNLYEAIDLMTTMVEQFGEPGDVATAASIATFWQMLEYLYSVNKNALASSSVQGVIDLIGETGNTGGSETAGTVMAKSNAVINYLANSTYGLNAIKTQVVKNQNWYAKAGTTTQAASFADVTSSIGAEVTTGNFIAPETGIYRLDISMSRTYSTSGSGLKGCDLNIQCNIATHISHSNVVVVKEILYQNGYEATTYTGTKTSYVYLEKGCQYNFKSSSINSSDGVVTKINSLTVKYVKTTI